MLMHVSRRAGLTRCSRHQDDGFTTAWVLGLTVIVLVLGMAVYDVWNVYLAQRTLTARADAAAAAAAQAVDIASYPTRLQLLAGDEGQSGSAAHLARARLNEDFGEGNVVVTSDCAGAPDTGKVIVCVKVDNTTTANQPTATVTVKQQVHFTIFRILGYSSQTVTASGTAGPR